MVTFLSHHVVEVTMVTFPRHHVAKVTMVTFLRHHVVEVTMVTFLASQMSAPAHRRPTRQSLSFYILPENP